MEDVRSLGFPGVYFFADRENRGYFTMRTSNRYTRSFQTEDRLVCRCGNEYEMNQASNNEYKKVLRLNSNEWVNMHAHNIENI